MEVFQSLYTCQALYTKHHKEQTKNLSDSESSQCDVDDSLVLHFGSCHCQRIRFNVRASKLILCVEIPSISRFRQATPLRCDYFELLSDESSVSHYDFQIPDETKGDNISDQFYAFCSLCGINVLYSPTLHPTEIFVNLECISKDNIAEIVTMPYPFEPKQLLEINRTLMKQMEFFCMASEVLRSTLSKYIYNVFYTARLSVISFSQLCKRFRNNFTQDKGSPSDSSNIKLVVIYEKDIKTEGSITDRIQLFNKWYEALLGDSDSNLTNTYNNHGNRCDDDTKDGNICNNVKIDSNNASCRSNVIPYKCISYDESQFNTSSDKTTVDSSSLNPSSPNRSENNRTSQNAHLSIDEKHHSPKQRNNYDITSVDCDDYDSLSLLSSDSDSSKSQIFNSARSDLSPIYLHNQLKEHLSRHVRIGGRSK